MNSLFSYKGKTTLIMPSIKAFNFILGSVFFCLLLFPIGANKANIFKSSAAIKTVVIDPGHGGHDTGCLGHTRVNEKKVALSIALKLGKYISSNFSDVNVIYTRKTDVFVELEERAAIANRNNADLFISIHCNAASSSAYGTETYVMGLHKTEGNLNVAKRENSVVKLEQNHEERYDGMDLNSDEAYIIMSLTQNANLSQSTLLADKIQDQFRERVGLRDRGVKAAGFWVLWRTTMPAVLVETGFLTNPKEEKFLNSDKGQDYIASAMYRAFKEYKHEMEQTGTSLDEINTFENPMDDNENSIGTTNTIEDQTDEINVTHTIDESDELTYRVQLLVSSKDYNSLSKKFSKIDNIIIESLPNGLKRYASGPYYNEHEAHEQLNQLKKKGL